MKITTLPATLRTDIQSLSHSGKVALVPTMGSLHEGHLQLIRAARTEVGTNGRVIVSIFVNPTQFDRTEDLNNYPRSMERDLDLCKQLGVDLAFTPEATAMYQPDHSVTVTEQSLTQRLCGATRPGHFDGVCTIVLKLFNLTGADIAVFGKKDYQQLAIIRRMARDLHLPIQIIGKDTVREDSGLALSSRNLRLTEDQRTDAARIRAALLAALTTFRTGETCATNLLSLTHGLIENPESEARIDYLELLDAGTLQPVAEVNKLAIIATAVFYGNIRLIDNIELRP